jgi:hypothetical protein
LQLGVDIEFRLFDAQNDGAARRLIGWRLRGTKGALGVLDKGLQQAEDHAALQAVALGYDISEHSVVHTQGNPAREKFLGTLLQLDLKAHTSPSATSRNG